MEGRALAEWGGVGWIGVGWGGVGWGGGGDAGGTPWYHSPGGTPLVWHCSVVS